MKLRNFALALTAAALLPAFAHAEDNADPIRASFEREFGSQYSLTTNEPDQVLASFERELNHEPAQFEVAIVNNEADPLDAIFAVLRPMTTMVHAKLAHVQNRDSSI